MDEIKFKKAKEIKQNIILIENADETLQTILDGYSLTNSSVCIIIPRDIVLMERIKDVLFVRKTELQNEFNSL